MQTAERLDRVDQYPQDLGLYCTDVLKILTKQGALVPFELNAAQRFVNGKLAAQRRATGRVRAICLKARQLGISTFVAGRFYRRVHLFQFQRAIVIADKRDRSGTLFEIYNRFDKFLPEDLRPIKLAQARRRELVYDTKEHGGGMGSQIVVETAGDKSSGRGSTTNMVHISEIAFWPNPEDVMTSILQAVPDEDSEVFIESTANGVGNYFHRAWEAAIAGESGFVPIFLPWWIEPEYRMAVPDGERFEIARSEDGWEREAMDEGFEWEGERYKLTVEQIAWRREVIRDKLAGDARKFRQEYPSTPEEAFLVSGASFFDEEKLVAYRKGALPPRQRGDIISLKGGVAVRPAERGYVRLWKFPRREGRYVIGADTASGRQVGGPVDTDAESERGGTDYSCCWVYDVTERAFVAVAHGRMAPEIFAEILTRLGHWYSNPSDSQTSGLRIPALVGVERINSGETVLKFLVDTHRYPRLFYHRRTNWRTREITKYLGWITDSETRPILVDTIAAEVRQERIWMPDADTVREMTTFVRGTDGRPQAQRGAHDDRVIAAAICLQIAEHLERPPTGEWPGVEVLDSPTGLMSY